MLFVLEVALAITIPAILFGLATFDLGKQLGRDEAADEFRFQRPEIREATYASGYADGYDRGYDNGYETARERCLAALTGSDEAEGEDDE